MILELYSKNEASINFVSAIITFGSLVLGALHFLKKKFVVSVGDHLEIEYWRFFGPSVPRLMELIEKNPTPTEIDEYHVYFVDGEYNSIVERKFWELYKETVKNKVILVSRRLHWDKYAGNREIGMLLDFLSKSSSDFDVFNYVDNNYIDESCSMDDIPDSIPKRKYGNYENDVGFLFLSIKNTSDVKLQSVSLNLKKAVVRLPSNLPDAPYRGSFQDIKDVFLKKNNPDKYLSSNIVNHQHGFTLDIPVWKPNEEFLFLMSVYRSDKNGFEKNYLDDAYKIESITGAIRDEKFKWEVREPLRAASTRVRAPYGWFRQ